MRILSKVVGVLFGIATVFFLLLTFVSGFSFSMFIIAILFLFLAIYSFKLPALMQKHRERISEKRAPAKGEAVSPSSSLEPIDTASSPVTAAAPAPESDSESENVIKYSFYVAGTSYREDDIEYSLLVENDEYSMSKRELVDLGLVNEKIYKYEPNYSNVSLIPDPENDYDENAIKVVVDGVHIGFVPKDRTRRVANMLKKDPEISCSIYGGPYKIVEEESPGDFIWDEDPEYTVVKSSSRIGAKVTLKYKKQ